MSKTPRTDEKEFAAIDLKPSARVVYASFCRQLENELAEARAALSALYGWVMAEAEHFGAHTPDDDMIVTIRAALAEGGGR